MKLKQEFILRNIAGDNLLVPVRGLGDSFNGLITLNETGTFIYKQIEMEKDEGEIVMALMEEYNVTQEKATEDVEAFCDNFRRLNIL